MRRWRQYNGQLANPPSARTVYTVHYLYGSMVTVQKYY